MAVNADNVETVQGTLLAESFHIVLIGVRNAGKSSLLNALFEKEVAIVSPAPGTTTDPVVRKMEISGLGPVAFVDTAGIDDEGDLGSARVGKTKSKLAQASIVLFVTPGNIPPQTKEKEMLTYLKNSRKPFLVVVTFGDYPLQEEKMEWLLGEGISSPLRVDNRSGRGAKEVREALSRLKELVVPEAGPLEGLVREGDTVLLVVPIDSAAPKGRLILPQVETIRDALDRNCRVVIVKEQELKAAYEMLKERPSLVITDSQAFRQVAQDIPEDQPLTSFSILFARKKGELTPYLEGLQSLEQLPPGARVLILEACSHHRQPDDIGSVKIPHLLRELVHPTIKVEQGRSIEGIDLSQYDLVIHCAACMMTRQAMLSRLEILKNAGISILNYGIFLAWANGLIPRALLPLPEYSTNLAMNPE